MDVLLKCKLGETNIENMKSGIDRVFSWVKSIKEGNSEVFEWQRRIMVVTHLHKNSSKRALYKFLLIEFGFDKYPGDSPKIVGFGDCISFYEIIYNVLVNLIY